MSDTSDISGMPNATPSAFERLVRSRWYGAGGIAGLSKLSGVSRATMYSWFRGETVPDSRSLARLAGVLDVTVAELVEAVGAVVEPVGHPITPAPSPRMTPIVAMRSVHVTPAFEAPRDQYLRAAATVHTDHARPVAWCSADDPIGPVARTLYEHHFSQLPVRDGDEWIGLLTTEAIARWMAGRSRHELDVEARAPVREVLAYADDATDFRVVPPDLPDDQIVALFDGAALRGQPLRAVLVAGSRRDASVMRIVTAYDLPHLRRRERQSTHDLSQPDVNLDEQPEKGGRS